MLRVGRAMNTDGRCRRSDSVGGGWDPAWAALAWTVGRGFETGLCQLVSATVHSWMTLGVEG